MSNTDSTKPILYKGNVSIDTAAFYCPYIPLQTSGVMAPLEPNQFVWEYNEETITFFITAMSMGKITTRYGVVDSVHISFSENQFDKEIDWCEQNNINVIVDNQYRLGLIKFRFESVSDAMLFKLKWA